VSGDPTPIVASGTGPPAAAAYLPRRIQTPPTYQQRREHGRAARQRTPRGIHAEWAPASDQPDPVDLLEAQAKNRDPDLAPIRYAHDPLSIHVPPRRGCHHGQRPCNYAAYRCQGSALWRLPPLELRGVCLPGAHPTVRRQRLRRDAARALGVGCQATRREPRCGWP
jgi:hypothetical protein